MTLQRVALEAPVITEDFAARLGKHSLHDMNLSRTAQRVVMFTPTVATVERLIGRWQAEVGTFTSLAAIRRVMSANPAAIQALARRESFDWANPSAEGFMAILPLSMAGHLALLDGRFAVGDPDPTHLVGQHEEAAAVYFAAIYAPGALAGGVGLAFDQVSTPLRREADLYARAGTPRGRRLVEGLGFTPLRAARDGEVSELYVFRRSRPAPRRPIYDSYPSATGQYGVTVVRNQDDLAKVMAVRSAAYIGEQTCPYDEEFDGNDFASTHLLGYVGDEPVASIRIRCFAEFAKVERLAVRQDHRQSRIAFVIVRAAHEICRVKGYTRIYGHAQKQLVPFWEKSSGARVLDGARDLVFSDFDYVEMVAEPAPHPDAISLASDPYVIIRPEGRWHVPGVLEKSAARPVTLHSADPQVRKRRRA